MTIFDRKIALSNFTVSYSHWQRVLKCYKILDFTTNVYSFSELSFLPKPKKESLNVKWFWFSDLTKIDSVQFVGNVQSVKNNPV